MTIKWLFRLSHLKVWILNIFLDIAFAKKKRIEKYALYFSLIHIFIGDKIKSNLENQIKYNLTCRIEYNRVRYNIMGRFKSKKQVIVIIIY